MSVKCVVNEFSLYSVIIILIYTCNMIRLQWIEYNKVCGFYKCKPDVALKSSIRITVDKTYIA